MASMLAAGTDDPLRTAGSGIRTVELGWSKDLGIELLPRRLARINMRRRVAGGEAS